MKKLLLVFMILPMISVGQVKKKALITKKSSATKINILDSLETFKTSLMLEFGTATEYQLLLAGRDAYKGKSLSYLADQIDSLPNGKLTLLGKPDELVTKNKDMLKKYLTNIYHFGASDNVLYYGNTNAPINFINYNNSIAFYQGGVVYNYTLNSFKLDVNARAKKIAIDVLIPSLKNFEPLLTSGVNFFCLSVTYLSHDFTKDYSLDKPELLSIVISKEILKKYLNADLTDKELIATAHFYNHNENMDSLDIKKIDIE